MGTFEGHVIPSIAYTLVALWWGFGTSVKYAREQRLNKSKFVSSIYQPCFMCSTAKMRTFPVESLLKVIGLSFHIFMEFMGGLHYERDPMTGLKASDRLVLEFENAHHICMISGFIVAAVVEILVYYKFPFPKNVEYIFNWLAFLIQVIIMSGHLSGDRGIEYTVHKLWTILIVLTFLAASCELYNSGNVWSAYLRIVFFMAQGTWLMQIAFVVWPHTDNPRFVWKDDHESHTWLNIYMMIHMIAALCVIMIQYWIVHGSIELWDKYYSKYELDVDTEPGLRLKLNDNREYSALLTHEEETESN